MKAHPMPPPRFKRIVEIGRSLFIIQLADTGLATVDVVAVTVGVIAQGDKLRIIHEVDQGTVRKHDIVIDHQHVVRFGLHGTVGDPVPGGSAVIASNELEGNIIPGSIKVIDGLEGIRVDILEGRDGDQYFHEVAPVAPVGSRKITSNGA